MRLDDETVTLPPQQFVRHSSSSSAVNANPAQSQDLFRPLNERAFNSNTDEVTTVHNQHQDDPDHFVGFWSLQPYEQDLQNTTVQDPASPDETKPHLPDHTDSHLFRTLYPAVSRPKKIDLSYWDPIKGEATYQYPTRSEEEDDEEEEDSAFRATTNKSISRQITKYFMQHVYPHVSAEHDLPDELATALLHHVTSVERRPGSVNLADVFDYSWILLAEDSAISIDRLAGITRQRERENSSPVPLWVIMQLLRLTNIDAKSLTHLIVLLKDRTENWDWSENQPMLLTVRLLRHARKSAPNCFPPILDLFLHLLRRYRSTAESMKRTAHWCNRLLSLLAIPTSVSPYKSMRAQQSSQLSLVRYMQESDPELPLMREGYRAIARLQLMHEKTAQERDWARAKALTWPPWEENHQMASVARPSHYPGKRSRVIKVLERMQEGGYALSDHELAIRILAGWDTDYSPTVQVRRTAHSISIAKPWEPRPSLDNVEYSPLIWSARVEATRTLREAWMCFCSYHAATSGKSRSAKVYHAFFKKLLARTLPYSPEGPLPGDGIEVFPDPELDRDRVYIPEEIPSVHDLFMRMVAQEIQPYTRLLGDLLRHEWDLMQGLHYVTYAAIEEKKRQILSSPGKHESSDVAEVLKALPPSLVRPYLGFLARPHREVPKHAPRPRFGGQSGPSFVKSVLESMGSREVSLWNAYLGSLTLHRDTRILARMNHHREPLLHIWGLASQATSRMRKTTTPINFMTFMHVATIAFEMASSDSLDPRSVQGAPTKLAKKLFQEAALNRPLGPARWQEFCKWDDTMCSIPTGDAIESMVWILGVGSAHSSTMIGDVLSLLHWVRCRHTQIFTAGYHVTVHNLATFRLFLEASWAGEEDWQTLEEGIHFMSSMQRQELRSIVEGVEGWPDDQYMERYMLIQRGRILRVRRKHKSVRVNESPSKDVVYSGPVSS
ncbi:hypothetical protein LTR70_001926 [Exophiala xenobiotica]|uniref:Uncharacterized protein n=1 Tax=Lithohypha guttulata TaxID=1690604 RepID=A0ABR0K944_9EURO|nr:hypothetical protein LTR24_005402 [Lithohypha guttulata]KAK5326911.1 hypothetical protein LTR70_001926 [Exophiala xenobiotica]